jgi:flagellar basal body-associated protein FliL
MAVRFGRWSGKQWRWYVRGEAEASRWLKGKKVPACVAAILVWAMRLGLLLLIVLTLISLAAVFVTLYVYSKCNGSSASEAKAGVFGEQRDHKKSVFYDPINYNDPDDPRFDDYR